MSVRFEISGLAIVLVTGCSLQVLDPRPDAATAPDAASDACASCDGTDARVDAPDSGPREVLEVATIGFGCNPALPSDVHATHYDPIPSSYVVAHDDHRVVWLNTDCRWYHGDRYLEGYDFETGRAFVVPTPARTTYPAAVLIDGSLAWTGEDGVHVTDLETLEDRVIGSRYTEALVRSGEFLAWLAHDPPSERRDVVAYDLASERLIDLGDGLRSSHSPRLSGSIVLYAHDSGHALVGRDLATERTFVIAEGGFFVLQSVSGDWLTFERARDEGDGRDLFAHRLSTSETFSIDAGPGYHRRSALVGDDIVWKRLDAVVVQALPPTDEPVVISSTAAIGDFIVEGDRVSWWERIDDRGHMIAYDLATGQLHAPIRCGEGENSLFDLVGERIVCSDDAAGYSDLYVLDSIDARDARPLPTIKLTPSQLIAQVGRYDAILMGGLWETLFEAADAASVPALVLSAPGGTADETPLPLETIDLSMVSADSTYLPVHLTPAGRAHPIFSGLPGSGMLRRYTSAYRALAGVPHEALVEVDGGTLVGEWTTSRGTRVILDVLPHADPHFGGGEDVLDGTEGLDVIARELRYLASTRR